jgi:hypothetical protein
LVKNNRRAERWPSGEVALPETVAQDHDGGGAGPVFFGEEGAPLREIHTQDGKEVGRDFAKVDVLGFSWLAERASIEERPGHLERTACALAIEKIRVGNILFAVDFCVPRIGMAVHGDELVGFWIGQRLQQHTIDEGEHHSRCANAERKGQQGYGSKPGPLAQGANRVAEILNEVFEPARTAGVAAFFLDLLEAAEGEAGAALGFVTRHAGCYLLRDFVSEMRAELIVEFGFDDVSSEQSAEAEEKIAEHEALPV